MNTSALSGALLAMGLAVSLAAQDAKSERTKAQDHTNTPFTAIGCVNRAVQSGSVGGSAGVPPAPPSSADVLANTSDPTNVFLLAGATQPDAPQQVNAETAAGKPPEEPAPYVLDGKKQELEAHLGHQVQVSGTLLMQTDPGPAATKSNVRHIQVASIKMMSETCPMPAGKPRG